ncbi:MaoC family dehydratase [Lysinibacillus sp. JNUCC-52]|uniref:MaoC family dehydratase n=1 Tax=Lysinibacillus sp. JNUCC-52 TaxID=2792480 RepID=UPI001935C225|nr:MaoC family dehydratase [Lysinibacillus sp. JNUCC-52]
MKKTVTAKQVHYYAQVSKDDAAIHINAEAAKQAGFERPIVHGMYLMGLAQSLYMKEHPLKWIVRYNMRFQKPLLIDEEVTFLFIENHTRIEVSISNRNNDQIALGNFEVEELGS